MVRSGVSNAILLASFAAAVRTGHSEEVLKHRKEILNRMRAAAAVREGLKELQKELVKGRGSVVAKVLKRVETLLRLAVDGGGDVPRYLMREDGRERFLPIQEAGRLYNSMWSQVEIVGRVLEDDGMTVRDITDAERKQIADIADEWDESK